jgi:hypothetical protein
MIASEEKLVFVEQNGMTFAVTGTGIISRSGAS